MLAARRGTEVHELQRETEIEAITPEERLTAIKECIERWASQQDQERCWFYPDLFRLLAKLSGAGVNQPKHLPPRAEFEAGCKRYADEEYAGVCEFCGGSGMVMVENPGYLGDGIIGPGSAMFVEDHCRWCWTTELNAALGKPK